MYIINETIVIKILIILMGIIVIIIVGVNRFVITSYAIQLVVTLITHFGPIEG